MPDPVDMLSPRVLLTLPVAVGVGSIGWGLYGAAMGAGGDPSVVVPDVLLVTLCSMRADHVHAYGYEGATTPNLDRLAATGTRYAHAYAAGAWTGSSHASLLTGVLPALHGVLDFGQHISPALPTLPQTLATYGYSTAAFQRTSGPMTFGVADGADRGFATFETDFRDAASLALRVGEWWRQAPRPAFALVHLREGHAPYGAPPAGTDPRLVAWQQSAFRPGPEGAHAGVVLAHDVAQEPILAAQLAGLYDVGVTTADAALGSVLDAVRPDPARSLVIVTGDHGEALGEGGHLGHKRYADEPVLHVPLVVRYPDGIEEPAVVDTEVSLTDLLPTVLDLARASRPALLDGRSLLGLGGAGPWAPGVADQRVQPAVAQVTDSVLGESAPLHSVVVTADWRLDGADGPGTLLARTETGWEEVTDKVVQRALKQRYLRSAALSTTQRPPELTPAMLDVLRSNGYW